MADELFELRNYFYLGNYTFAVTEGTTISLSDDASRIERDVILNRIKISNNQLDEVINSISDNSPMGLQSLKLYAQYLKDPSSTEIVLLTLKEWLEDDVSASNPTLLLVAAMIYSHEDEYELALKNAHAGGTLEHIAMKVQILLKMDRPDVAQSEVDTMKQIDEDATLTQLANAWTYLSSGSQKGAQEALYIFQELCERHGGTDLVLNGIAACQIYLGKYEEAEKTMQEALVKNPDCPDTLINSIINAKHRQKPAELINRYFAQLKQVAPNNTWLKKHQEKSDEFDALIAQMS